MFPLNAVLVGVADDVLPHVRRELDNLNATIEAEVPTVAAAVKIFRLDREQKRVAILQFKSSHDLERLKHLRNAFGLWPIVVLLETQQSGQIDGSLLIEAMRAGAAQIVPLPLAPADFQDAMRCVVSQFAFAPDQTEFVAVGGATGGCGATTVAVNLAYEVAFQYQIRCVLVDLSLKLGDVATHLDLKPKYTIHDLLADVQRIDTRLVQLAFTEVAENFFVLAGSDQIQQTPSTTPQDLDYLGGVLRQLSDVVVMNLPCSYDDLYFNTLANVTHSVLVGEQSIPSIRALRLVRESLAENGERHDYVVINRYDPRMAAFTADRLLQPIGVDELFTIARDPAVVTALNNGVSLRLENTKSPALADIDRLLQAIFPSRTFRDTREAKKGIFNNIMKRMSRT